MVPLIDYIQSGDNLIDPLTKTLARKGDLDRSRDGAYVEENHANSLHT